MKCQDKALRKYLYVQILADVKKIKLKQKDHKLLGVRYMSWDLFSEL